MNQRKPSAAYFNGVIWVPLYNRATFDQLGFIPSFLSTDDPRPAAAQIADNYIAGWSPFRGFTLLPNGNLSYPEDPPLQALWMGKLRDETLHFYEHEWFRITQADKTWEVARLD